MACHSVQFISKLIHPMVPPVCSPGFHGDPRFGKSRSADRRQMALVVVDGGCLWMVCVT